jgi:hypothetical protein
MIATTATMRMYSTSACPGLAIFGSTYAGRRGVASM